MLFYFNILRRNKESIIIQINIFTKNFFYVIEINRLVCFNVIVKFYRFILTVLV